MKISLIYLTMLICSICSKGQSSYIDTEIIEDRSTLPLSLPPHSQLPLKTYRDNDVQKALVSKIMANPHWRRLIEQKKMAISLVDMRNPDAIKYSGINENTMLYAASLPKIAILLSTMDALEKGEIEETPEIDRDLKLMISKSDNQASTRLIDLLGYQKIADVLRNPKYELYHEKHGGGLWVGKRYAKTGERNPDPIKGLSHAATTYQVSRFYYLMASGRLISKERSKQMLDVMEEPALHHKFVNTLDKIAPEARLFRKSGSWQNYHSDSILVWGSPDRRYILVALIEDADGENIIRQLVMPVEEVLNVEN